MKLISTPKNAHEAAAVAMAARELAAAPQGVGHDYMRSSLASRGSPGGPGVSAYRVDRRALRGVGQGEVQAAVMRTQACGGDVTSPIQGGQCVVGQACEYDPAIYCGWSALPFSTFKEQGNTPNVDSGPVAAGFATLRTIQVTAERACKFRIRGVWMRAYQAGTTTISSALLANVEINIVPRVIEVGGIAPPQRIGIPSNLFDGSFWVLPVDWGTLSPINNNSRPLRLQFTNPTAEDVDVVGVLFGDPISEGGSPMYGNVMI